MRKLTERLPRRTLFFETERLEDGSTWLVHYMRNIYETFD